jgi:oligo-1,6-glucosidase/alpha-glucosidase
VPTYVFSNHDRIRSISRLGGSVEKAKLLALFQFTVRGVPFTYNGEELGIPRMEIPLKQGKDPVAQRYRWMPQFLVNMSGESINRDECRTPMLWNDRANAGFTTGTQPWLPVSANYKKINAERQQKDAGSLLQFYQKVIALRNETPALQTGKLEIAEQYCSKHVLAFYRALGNERYLTLLNMSKKQVEVNHKGVKVLSTVLQNENEVLQPFEGRVVKID